MSMAYACKNLACSHPGVSYKSAEAEMLSMKHSSYGYDVLALVGELRFKHHLTVKELADALNERGIPTSERHAQNLYERSQVLLADMKSGAAVELQSIIQPVIELGLPIVGIVSDGQHSIRLAFEGLLPDVPYQYCQYHYLKDIAKPVVDADRKLKTELKKSMRGIRDVERKIERIENPARETENSAMSKSEKEQAATEMAEAQIARKYISAVRALLLEDVDPLR
ncbi:MAG: hypothetical protein E7L01_31745 [Paenibacillus macerans]|uniref:hypothetical protein n=1 Tax=Paenibacillus TaxID=44249 RepID=UPI002431B37D|nr:hypothetical protein [Paenibacillus macerans]MDU7477881.1 hypothetical protein [Paenibacillus macerans]